jgi:hypothetical protein
MNILNRPVGQAEMYGMKRADFGADTALLAQIVQDCRFIFNQAHDMGGTAFDTNATAVAFKHIYFRYHILSSYNLIPIL